MAASLIPIRSPRFRAYSTPGHRDPDPSREITSRRWWSPLFGYSTDADYIDSRKKESRDQEQQSSKLDQGRSELVTALKLTKSQFTDEKARHLRLLTTSTSSFHDIMYHSAIASRLASDFPKRSDM